MRMSASIGLLAMHALALGRGGAWGYTISRENWNSWYKYIWKFSSSTHINYAVL